MHDATTTVVTVVKIPMVTLGQLYLHGTCFPAPFPPEDATVSWISFDYGSVCNHRILRRTNAAATVEGKNKYEQHALKLTSPLLQLLVSTTIVQTVHWCFGWRSFGKNAEAHQNGCSSITHRRRWSHCSESYSLDYSANESQCAIKIQIYRQEIVHVVIEKL